MADVCDYRFSSLNSAIDFSKSNNLLGVILDASLLVRLMVLSKTRILIQYH